MPRDKAGKNRKFGHHKDKNPHVGNLSEEDLLQMMTKKKGDSDSDSENEEIKEEESSEEPEQEGFCLL